MKLGKYISIKRKALGMSQKELASKVSITPPYLNDIEHGRRNPRSEELLAQFANVLDLDLKYLSYLAGKFTQEMQDLNLNANEFSNAMKLFRRGEEE